MSAGAGGTLGTILLWAALLWAAAAGAAGAQQPPLESPPSRESVEPRVEGGQPAGQLPWSARDRQAAPPQSPREMLELFDIGDSQLRSLFDGQPLGAADEETLVKLLFRFPRMGEENIHRWRTETPLGELAAEPDAHRAQVVAVDGIVTRIERREVIDELARLYSFDHYWALTVRPQGAAGSDYELVVCTREIPRAWGERPRDEASFRAAFNAFFLKVGARGPERKTQLVLAASRARWFPVAPQPELGVTPSHVLLAKHGMDAGQFAELPDQNGRPLNAHDREAFYNMLSAVRAIGPAELDEARPPPADLEALLVRPETVHGELMSLRVRAARIVRIEVEDEDIRDRFGIDSYYMIDVYLPLGERSVRLGGDEDSPEYKNTFPATLCVADLPPSMRDIDRRMAAGQAPTEVLDGELRADGFFFKIWSYRSEFIDEQTPGKRQPAPLLMPARLQILPPQGVSADALSIAFGAGFLVLLAAVALTLWLTGRRDAAYEKQQQERRFRPARPLDELDAGDSDGPDFGGLDQ